jgi:hypothetical protein
MLYPFVCIFGKPDISLAAVGLLLYPCLDLALLMRY